MVSIEHGKFRGPARGPCCVVGKKPGPPDRASVQPVVRAALGPVDRRKLPVLGRWMVLWLGTSYLSCDANGLEARRPRK